jgi:tetratricopeptide (TPR) repeat protein
MSPLAEALRYRGALAEAQALNERLIAAATATLGGEHYDTLVYINNLGLTLMGKGDYAAARPHLEHVLEIERRVLAPDDRALLSAINNLAICRRTLGDYAGALALQKEDVAGRQRRFGRDSPDTAAALYNLANTTELMGDAATAMALHREALYARIRALGPIHPDTLISKHAVGLALMRKGDLIGARAMQEEVLAAFTALYGANHTDRLMALGNLGSTLYRLGETEVAHAMLVEVAEKRAATLGEDHPDTLLAQAALASTSGGVEGIALMERTISTQARIFGDEHPATLERRAALVTMLYNSGAVADALALADQVYAARVRVLGEAHPQVRGIAEQALTAAMTLQDPAQIEVKARRLLAICERSDSLEHTDALTAASALGAALVALNRTEEARVVLAPNLERLERIEGWSSRATFAGAWPLAFALLQLGEAEAAIALLARLDQAASATLGPDDPEVLNYLTMLANARFTHGDYLEAARDFERLATAYGAQSGENSPAALRAREHYATALAHGGELARALSLLEALHEARLATDGPQHDDVQRLAASIAQVRAAMAAGVLEASAPGLKNTAPRRAAIARYWIAGAILIVIAAAIAVWSANHVAW